MNLNALSQTHLQFHIPNIDGQETEIRTSIPDNSEDSLRQLHESAQPSTVAS